MRTERRGDRFPVPQPRANSRAHAGSTETTKGDQLVGHRDFGGRRSRRIRTDSLLKPVPTVRSRPGPRRRGPDKLHIDKAYNSVEHRSWLRRGGIMPRPARIGVDLPKTWIVERSVAWLADYRRLTLRHERCADALTCYKRLKRPSMTWSGAERPVVDLVAGTAGSLTGPRPSKRGVSEKHPDLAILNHTAVLGTARPDSRTGAVLQKAGLTENRHRVLPRRWAPTRAQRRRRPHESVDRTVDDGHHQAVPVLECQGMLPRLIPERTETPKMYVRSNPRSANSSAIASRMRPRLSPPIPRSDVGAEKSGHHGKTGTTTATRRGLR